MEPRIYVASLSDYNAGVLHGRWIDAAQDADDIQAEVAAMLRESHEPHAEEWAIHDYEDFGGITISESESFATVAEIAAKLAEHGPAWAAYCDRMGGLEYAGDFEEDYCGEYDSEESYAAELIDDIGELKEDSLASRYFDYDAFTRDLFMSDNWSAPADGCRVYVFRTS